MKESNLHPTDKVVPGPRTHALRRAETANLLRGSPMDVCPRVVEFGGVWHWPVTEILLPRADSGRVFMGRQLRRHLMAVDAFGLPRQEILFVAFAGWMWPGPGGSATPRSGSTASTFRWRSCRSPRTGRAGPRRPGALRQRIPHRDRPAGGPKRSFAPSGRARDEGYPGASTCRQGPGDPSQRSDSPRSLARSSPLVLPM